jgi:4,5-DOPA dioxygenase extradiol
MRTQPALFVSHGAPTFALEPGLAGAQLGALGRALRKPRAVVVVSPHWQTRGIEISAGKQPETVHDFGGFPRALYQIHYPAPGAPDVARRAQEVLADAGMRSSPREEQGLDHGAWVPLLHLFPGADVPVVQVSMPRDLDAAEAHALGRGLAPLADEDVLVIGSGSLTHNLYEFRTTADGEAAYAREFTQWVRQAVVEGDRDRLIATLERAPHAQRAHPSHEHFLPLLVALGAARDVLPATVLDGGIRHGVLAMESYVFGAKVNIETEVDAARGYA